MKKPPCKNCEMRRKSYPACRNGCEQYIHWQETMDRALEAKREYERAERDYWGVRKTGLDER